MGQGTRCAAIIRHSSESGLGVHQTQRDTHHSQGVAGAGLVLQEAAHDPLGSKARFVRAVPRYRTPGRYDIIHIPYNSIGSSLQKLAHVVVEAEEARSPPSARWRSRKPMV